MLDDQDRAKSSRPSHSSRCGGDRQQQVKEVLPTGRRELGTKMDPRGGLSTSSVGTVHQMLCHMCANASRIRTNARPSLQLLTRSRWKRGRE